jgi:hypothetical protein
MALSLLSRRAGLHHSSVFLFHIAFIPASRADLWCSLAVVSASHSRCCPGEPGYPTWYNALSLLSRRAGYQSAAQCPLAVVPASRVLPNSLSLYSLKKENASLFYLIVHSRFCPGEPGNGVALSLLSRRAGLLVAVSRNSQLSRCCPGEPGSAALLPACRLPPLAIVPASWVVGCCCLTLLWPLSLLPHSRPSRCCPGEPG